MPTISTGNTAWDQGLGNLSGALFPDPSKVAQAGYYGAEQRKAQLDAAKTQEQLAAGHQFLGIMTGQMPGQPQYRTDPATNQQILADTAASGGPPSAPSAASPPPAPISSAVVGPPPGSAPGPVPGSAPAAAPGFQGGGEGGGAGPPAVAPIANLIAESVSKASTSNSGPPLPPASPPAPGTPPAPNTTGTDGSTPADNGAGILHPGSFTPAGGGVKMSGAAAPDGSPAPTAVNLGQLVALGVMKGMPAADAMGVARTMVAGWVKNGQMDQQHADDMLADLGETAMRVANINNAGALTRTNAEVAGRRDVANIDVAGREKVAGMPTTFVADDPNDPTKGHYVPLAQQQGPGGTASFAPAATTTAAAPVLTQAKPGAPVIPSTQGQAARSGTPVYTPGTADITQQQGGAYDTYMDPKNPGGQPITTTAADAATRGLVKYGTMTPTPLKPAEQNQQSFIDHGVDQSVYQQPQKGSLTSPGFVDAPVVFSDAAQAKIQTLTTQIMRSGQAGGNASNARGMAIRVLQGSGDLPSVGQVNALRNQGGVVSTAGGRVSDPRLAQSPTYDGTGKVVPHLWVGLKGETNPNDPGAPTAFNPEPGPRAGSKTAPQQQQQQQQQPPAAPVASGPAYRPTSDIFGSGGGPPAPGTTPGPAPVPAWQSYLNRPARSGPAPLTPGQMYGGVPTAPPAPAGPAGPAGPAAPAAPNQPIARAAPNQRDGEIAYLNGRPIGIVRGGAVYPMPAPAGPGGGG